MCPRLERTSDAGTVFVTGEVLRDTTVVMGVECVTVSEKVSSDGLVLEESRDWYAQDSAGSVWHFGRAVETYEGDKIVSTAGSWEAGVDGALPGIVMKPDPRVGDVYVGRYLNGEAKDMAEVLALDATVEVPHGAFTGVAQDQGVVTARTRGDHGAVLREGLGSGLGRTSRGGHGQREAGLAVLPLMCTVGGESRRPGAVADRSVEQDGESTATGGLKGPPVASAPLHC